MKRIILKDEKWYDENGNYVGVTVPISSQQFAIRTLSGDLKPFRLGWVDQLGTFYDICSLPYTVCANHCDLYKTKVCRYSSIMQDEGYYMLD